MRTLHTVALLVLAGFAAAQDVAPVFRAKNDDRDTSSSSGEKGGSDSNVKAESLDLSVSGSSSEKDSKVNKYKPKSSQERTGWRKWHRKCTPCPEDRELKWRDPRIGWICGGYQRARRSFKSICMMHYRNCQDGTMFVKIHQHRCANSTTRSNPTNWTRTGVQPHGTHFFYDYRVMLSIDSTGTKSSSSSSESNSEKHSGDDGDSGWRRHHHRRRNMQRKTSNKTAAAIAAE